MDRRPTIAETYWLVTITPAGRPHATPVWGVWIACALYLDGIPTARWARNLANDPCAVIHLESGIDVIVLDGEVAETHTDFATRTEIVARWRAKYGRLEPEPVGRGLFCFRPSVGRAWSRFPHDGTRWRFG